MYLIKPIHAAGTPLLRRRWQMSWPLTVLLLFAVSGAITLCCVYLQPGSLVESLRTFLRQRRLIWLNWFPALIFTAVLWMLTKNLFAAGAVCGGVMAALSYANLLKYEGREDTLVPADILLLREALDAAQDYQLNLHWGKLAGIALMVAVFVILAVYFRSAAPVLPLRLAGAAAGVLAFVLSVQMVYTDRELYNSFSVPNIYNIGSVYNTLGFNYCFLYNFRLNPVDRPEGYSRAEVEGWYAEAPEPAAADGVQPNIVIVMCEAFTDLAAEEMFTYAPEDNPLRDFYRAADTPSALTGHIVVTNYGAGTANTEFNVLTGMQTAMIGEGTTSAFRTVRKRTDNVASVLAEDGYRRFFMHPGASWFYNRSSVYAHFGITDQIFNDVFDETDFKGTMISDAAFLEELKRDLEARVTGEAPVFCYTVTIQNHQAYPWSKYDEPAPLVQTSAALSDGATEQLSVYMEGVRDSSAMLLELTEYLDALEEPTLLVFFGDHRPNVGNAVTELGLDYNIGGAEDASPAQILATYSVPFLLRGNRAYAEAVNLPAAFAALELPENGCVSDNYLGALVLELTGHGGENPFFDFLNQMRRVLPVARPKEGVYMLPDGSLVTALTPEQAALVEKLDKWTYYLLT